MSFVLNPFLKMQEKLRAYLDEVLRANREFNLTAVRDPETAWSKHVLDSLQGLEVAGLFDGTKRVVDVGTGAGFPGMILAIARPELSVTLLDATRKKCNFLEAAARDHAPNVTVICGRAEEAGHEHKMRAQFDIAVARAVGSFTEICELCLPLVKVGGKLLLWRGQDAAGEIEASQKALKMLGGRARVVASYYLPDHEMQYHLTMVEKQRSTPGIYPRRVGLPKHQPL